MISRIKSLICFILTLALVFVPISFVWATGDEKTYSYRWTRVESESELETLFAQYNEKDSEDVNTDANTTEDALHVLIVYVLPDSNTAYYFKDNIVSVNSNNGFLEGSSIFSGFITAGGFTTTTDNDTPLIKNVSGVDFSNSVYSDDETQSQYVLYDNDGNILSMNYTENSSEMGSVYTHGTLINLRTIYQYSRVYPKSYMTAISCSAISANGAFTDVIKNDTRRISFNLSFIDSTEVDNGMGIFSFKTPEFPFYEQSWANSTHVNNFDVSRKVIANVSYTDYLKLTFESTNSYAYLEPTLSTVNPSQANGNENYDNKASSFNRSYPISLFAEEDAYEERAAFYIYVAEKFEVPALGNNTTFDGVKILNDNATIKHNEIVTVTAGNTLVVDGIVYNYGIIKLDGGTLIVRGNLVSRNDNVAGLASTAGGIEARSGTILVLSDGQIVSSNRSDVQINLDAGSYLYNEGCIVFPAVNMSNRSRLTYIRNAIMFPTSSDNGRYLNDGVESIASGTDLSTISNENTDSKIKLNDTSIKIFTTGIN